MHGYEMQCIAYLTGTQREVQPLPLDLPLDCSLDLLGPCQREQYAIICHQCSVASNPACTHEGDIMDTKPPVSLPAV